MAATVLALLSTMRGGKSWLRVFRNASRSRALEQWIEQPGRTDIMAGKI
jgi:hypothetical protein